MNDILRKLRSIELFLSAHPENEEHSEMADRLSSLQEVQKEVEQLIYWKESATNLLNDIDLQEVGKAMGLKPGEDIGKQILPFIKKIINDKL